MSITQPVYREIIKDFQKAINEKKIEASPPKEIIINFRNDVEDKKPRKVYEVPLELLRYRKENGRISSSVLSYERTTGTLDQTDLAAQKMLAKFLKGKNEERTKELKQILLSEGQREPGIITCDGFLINGNRRRVVLEELRDDHPDQEKFARMKVVILPGKGEEGGAPTLKEIEQIENRYQLQRDGKAEYSGFDAALSIRQKIECGFTLREQLKDDPQFKKLNEKEFKRIEKKKEKELLDTLSTVDRYLNAISRPGQYNYISKGPSDSEGRWQAFIDYTAFREQLKSLRKRDEMNIREDEVGAIEQAAFKIIRLREIPKMGKVHTIMQDLPRLCKHAKEELLELNRQVKNDIPEEERIDDEGKNLSPYEIERKWQQRNKNQITYRLTRAHDRKEGRHEREAPLNLLRDAYKKLCHDDMNINSIDLSNLDEAQAIANELKKLITRICTDIYESKKTLSLLKDRGRGKAKR